MIHDASRSTLPLHLEADLCIIGSGPGGGMVARVAAEVGWNVLLLEAGGFIPPESMTQREEEMIPQLLWAGGARASADHGVLIHQGRGLGGSSLHNLNLCKRIPAPILAAWQRSRGLEHLPPEMWATLYAEVEARLSVSAVPRDQWNRHNQLLEKGCNALGWRGGGLRHNRTGCVGSGFCELGCAFDAKNNVPKVLLPPAIEDGLRIATRTQAVEVLHADGKVEGVFAVALDPATGRPLGEVHVRAPRVCLAASATGSAALLLRSNLGHQEGGVGRTLHLHPAVLAAGDFDEPVLAWKGIPQTYECTQFLDFDSGATPTAPGTRTWIVPAFAHPMATATLVPGFGTPHRALMERYAHLAVLTAMVHDTTAGRVSARSEYEVRIDYTPNADDRRELAHGLVACARLLFAAGARRVFIPTDPLITLQAGEPLPAPEHLRITPDRCRLSAVHPMGTIPMGDDPAQAAVDSRGRHHEIDGLWVADGSLFPSSIGVPPQLSIYALGLHVGRSIIAAG